MIPRDYITELVQRSDIVDVVQSYVQLRHRGRTHTGLCPFHNEKTPSFVVYPETQSFYCFGCGAGGDAVSFTKRINSIDYIEAVKLLAQRAGMPEPTEDDPDPEQQTDYILHITVSSKTVDELAELYNFTQDQKDILHQLLSEEMRPSLLALCGGIAVADGELCWPLPGHTYISCHFGEVDAFGNAGHRGTDIPAPEGTPILAAHSGTVLVSGWNDSYGNQVLLDNGAGLGRPQLNSKS